MGVSNENETMVMKISVPLPGWKTCAAILILPKTVSLLRKTWASGLPPPETWPRTPLPIAKKSILSGVKCISFQNFHFQPKDPFDVYSFDKTIMEYKLSFEENWLWLVFLKLFYKFQASLGTRLYGKLEVSSTYATVFYVRFLNKKYYFSYVLSLKTPLSQKTGFLAGYVIVPSFWWRSFSFKKQKFGPLEFPPLIFSYDIDGTFLTV